MSESIVNPEQRQAQDSPPAPVQLSKPPAVTPLIDPASGTQPPISDQPAPPLPAVPPTTGAAGQTEWLSELQPGALAAPVVPNGTARAGLAVRVGAAVVVAALVGVGIGIGIIQVKYPDGKEIAGSAGPTVASSGPSPSAAPSPVFGAKENGNHFGAMLDLLLPLPTGYALGPDDGAYGNNTELTPEQLAGELDDTLKDLPKDQRDKVRANWQALHIKGAGVRSIKRADNAVAVGFQLRQFNQQAVGAQNEFVGAFVAASGIFREGPGVPGHPEAHCFLPPAPPGEELDYLQCSAAEGDLLVVMKVEGVAPLPKDSAIALFTQQLDRLARPGASA